ncbi:MAG: serine/threonine protein kinase [Solirubrobacterales bacterium]|nr:serine/threonine protein kinase [Solirubrobacterales bacterium]
MQQATRKSGAHPPAHPGPGNGELVLGRYRPVRRIGSGGMGVVWLAHDEKLDRPVAIKRIAVDDEAVAKRAAREAKAAARLAHPAIVALHETGRDDDAVYLVSELVVGSTLAQLLAEGALSDRDVLEIGAALCDALAHAHGRGVVHRDVKPQNVIVPDTQQNGAGVAKLTDFGIAMLTDEDVLTRTGDIVGTLAYMAPEQAEGREVTAQADVYALGLVIYEALSGTNPVRGRTPAATARRVGERLPKLERLRRDLPRELCAAIDRAVDPDPRARGKVTALRTVLRSHGKVVDDEPGTVDGGTLETVTRVTRLAARRMPTRGPHPHDPSTWEPTARHAEADADAQRHAWRHSSPSVRAAAAVGAGALTTAALAGLGPEPPLTAPAGAIMAAVTVAALPRLGSLALPLALAAWLVVAPEGGTGLALLVLAAGLPTALALWRERPAWWSAPALAPLLGLLALATAWPAIAGQARRVTHRLILGALGCWWLLLAQALTGRTLLVGPVPGVDDPARWTGSAQGAAGQVIAPLITSGALGIALVWGLAAAVLPCVVRGRAAAVDLLMGGAWAAGLAAGTQGVASALRWPDGPPQVHGVVAPAILAGVIAVAARASRGVA